MAPNATKQRRGQAPVSAYRSTPANKSTLSTPSLPLWKTFTLLILAALWSPISQLTLSPTHGSIPASLYHPHLTTTILLLTIPLDSLLTYLPLPLLIALQKPQFLLPILATSVPPLQYFLTPPTLAYLGPARSALVLEMCTYAPLLAMSLHLAGQGLRRVLPRSTAEPIRKVLPPALATGLVYALQHLTWAYIPALFGSGPGSSTNPDTNSLSSLLYSVVGAVFGRATAPTLLSLLTALLLPHRSLLLLLALLALPLSHTLLRNPHTPLPYPSHRLTATLKDQGYALLARAEGPTGYISVLENQRDGFRVMRCDHSLLGGEWVFGVGGWPGGEGGMGSGMGGGMGSGMGRGRVGEPVYTVFVMLEAVRLVRDQTGEDEGEDRGEVEYSPVVRDEDAKALVVGLGIGTTPAALVAQGIRTTVVEIDPVVFAFAREYFALPANLTGVVQDATVFVRHDREKYDYIVHDVFTGGAEPAELFTVEFIRGLRRRLNEDGVIAINYAGDLLLPPASLIVRTILSVFPTCRLYREDAPKEDPTTDFTNIIFFCRKSKKPFSFRNPTQADFLQTMSRKQGLVPKYEVDPQSFDLTGEKDGIGRVLSDKNTSVLQKWKAPGAMGHWEVMRTVLPPAVWENW